MKKKGFTLIELLAVIIILAVIALIATPIVLNVVDNARESARKSSIAGYADATRMAVYDYQFANKGAYPNVDKTWADSNVTTGGEKVACEEVKFGGSGVVLKDCQVESNEKKYCFANGKVYDDCNDAEFLATYDPEQKPINRCTFEGDMVQGAEYEKGAYVYRYKQKFVVSEDERGVNTYWRDMEEDGWTVHVNPDYLEATEITTSICSEINGKPIVNTSYMLFGESNKYYLYSDSSPVALATSINLEGFDTNYVTDMNNMFSDSKIMSLDLSNFNTSNVTNMRYMFLNSQATEIKFSEKFNTSNVTDMFYMFSLSKSIILDLSNFDTNNVTNMNGMFANCTATTGYAKTQTDADRFNNATVTGIPDTLTFKVK